MALYKGTTYKDSETYYEEKEVDGGFSSGQYITFHRRGNLVTISSKTALGHPSANSPITSAGFTPEKFRPKTVRASNCYYYDQTNGQDVFINLDGSIQVVHRNESGTVNRTGTGEAFSVTFTVL